MAEKYKELFLKGIYKQPTLRAKEWNIKDEYKEFKHLCGGNIEVVPFPGLEDVLMVVNEEGKIYDLAANVVVREYDDVIVGPIVVVGEHGDGFRSLTAKEIQTVVNYLNENDYYVQLDKVKMEEKTIEEASQYEEMEREL